MNTSSKNFFKIIQPLLKELKDIVVIEQFLEIKVFKRNNLEPLKTFYIYGFDDKHYEDAIKYLAQLVQERHDRNFVKLEFNESLPYETR